MRHVHLSRSAIAAATVLAAAGCASPSGVQAPDGPRLQPYSGTWLFDPDASRRSEFRFWVRNPVTDDEPPQAVQDDLLAAAEVWPARFTLAITDSLFNVSADAPESSLALPLDGGWVEADGFRTRITLRRGNPFVERGYASNGWMRDQYVLTEDGALVITRKLGFFTNEADGWLEFTYRRQR